MKRLFTQEEIGTEISDLTYRNPTFNENAKAMLREYLEFRERHLKLREKARGYKRAIKQAQKAIELRNYMIEILRYNLDSARRVK